MQLKTNGFTASYPDNAFIEEKGNCKGSYCSAISDVYVDNPDTTGPTDVFIPFDIPAGSIVNIKIETNRRGSEVLSVVVVTILMIKDLFQVTIMIVFMILY